MARDRYSVRFTISELIHRVLVRDVVETGETSCSLYNSSAEMTCPVCGTKVPAGELHECRLRTKHRGKK